MVHLRRGTCYVVLGIVDDVRSPWECLTMHRSIRQTGITTEQMKKAPRDAIYVWVNHHFDYPRTLAKKLGRDDVRVVSPSFLASNNLCGLLRPVILDHATVLTRPQREEYEAHCAYCKARFDNKDRKI